MWSLWSRGLRFFWGKVFLGDKFEGGGEGIRFCVRGCREEWYFKNFFYFCLKGVEFFNWYVWIELVL